MQVTAFRNGKRRSAIQALGFAALLLLTMHPDVRAQSASEGEGRSSAAIVMELNKLVQERGWIVNLGRVCAVMRFDTGADCRFKQLSISTSEPGTVDNHGFNVPLDTSTDLTDVLVFHLGPLVGNFFVVSSDGGLKASYYRARGVDFTQIPNEEAQSAFAASIAFWDRNLRILKEDLAKGGTGRR